LHGSSGSGITIGSIRLAWKIAIPEWPFDRRCGVDVYRLRVTLGTAAAWSRGVWSSAADDRQKVDSGGGEARMVRAQSPGPCCRDSGGAARLAASAIASAWPEETMRFFRVRDRTRIGQKRCPRSG
jgi:hypothetical protein